MKRRNGDLDTVELTPQQLADSSDSLAEYAESELVVDDWDSASNKERVERIQDSLLQRSSEVLEAAMAFQDIEPDDESPPEQWVRRMGSEAAWRRFRVAKASWQSGKTAPIGITVARNLYVGITKANAQSKAAPQQLNVAVSMNVPVPAFEVVDVD